MEMEDHQYSIPDLRQLMTGRPLPTHFHPNIVSPPDLFSSHNRNLTPHPHHHHHGHQYDMFQMVGARDFLPRGLNDFPAESSATVNAAVTATVSTPSSVSGFDNDGGMFGGDGGTGRWPRQETLTLLEIRSRLDPKFKEANQKGPLWDEVSRILSEEHGYQRSGKKCREKFENLYKYYKKTKEGKAGRQDGKHYRFFRQLEALYGDTSSTSMAAAPEYSNSNLVGTNFRFNNNPNNDATQEGYHPLKLSDSLSLSNHTSEFDTSSSEEGIENDSRRKRRGGRGWKVKIKEFIDAQMKKLMEKQEVWLEKLTKTLEEKEQERRAREEEWRKQDLERIDREHKFWAKEREWIEARDATLMEALQTVRGVERVKEGVKEDGSHETVNNDGWGDSEIRSLIQLRSSMESRFHTSGCSEEMVWEEIASKLSCLGYDKRSGGMCREKWDGISNNFLRKKKRVKENNSKSGGGGDYYGTHEALYNPVVGNYSDGGGSSPSNSNVGNAAAAVNDGCFPFLMSDGENLWGNYGLKLNKGED